MVWNFPWFRRQLDKPVAYEEKNMPFLTHFFNLDGDASQGTQGDYHSLSYAGFMGNPVVHRAVRMIAQACSNIPWLLYEGGIEHHEHPFLDLLNRPNDRQAGRGFMESLYGHLLLSGNAYVEFIFRNEKSCALHLLRPDYVKIVTDQDGWPFAFDYVEGNKKKRRVFLEMHESGCGVHLSLFNPLDDHYGFSPLGSALLALDTHNAAGRWNKALLKNSARPSGVLVYDPKEGGNLNQEQFQRLKDELEENYVGASRAGRPMLLEGGLDWKQIGLTPRDMDFIETKNSASRDIALAFGIPPMLIGIPGDNTYTNYQEANRAFYRLTVLPLVTRTAKDFSSWIAPFFGNNLRLGLDLDQVEGLSAEREALWSRINDADFLTNDEKREAVGYGTIEKTS